MKAINLVGCAAAAFFIGLLWFAPNCFAPVGEGGGEPPAPGAPGDGGPVGRAVPSAPPGGGAAGDDVLRGVYSPAMNFPEPGGPGVPPAPPMPPWGSDPNNPQYPQGGSHLEGDKPPYLPVDESGRSLKVPPGAVGWDPDQGWVDGDGNSIPPPAPPAGAVGWDIYQGWVDGDGNPVAPPKERPPSGEPPKTPYPSPDTGDFGA